MTSSSRSRPTSRALLALVFWLLPLVPTAAAQIALDMVHAVSEVSVVDEFFAGKRYVSEWRSAGHAAEYNGVVLQGFSGLADLRGFVRFRDGSDWTAWRDLYIVRSVTDAAFLAGFHGDRFYSGAEYQVHFEGDGDGHPILVAAGVFDTRLDERQNDAKAGDHGVAGGAERGAPGKRSGPTEVTPPVLVTRAQWNASPFIGTPSPLAPFGYTNMTFHHAAGFTATTLEQGRAQVKAIQDFHQNGRGWSDIGYQFVIDRGGNVYQGRPFLDGSTTLEEVPALSLGAHVGGFNTGNIGICLLGCYHPPEGSNCVDQITDVSLDAYVTMFAYLGEAYDIPINSETLKGHRDFSATSCPGDNNYALLPSIRTQAVELQQFGSDRPDDFFVEPNFPNPFAGETTIRYYLQDEGNVDVTVYDLEGREVANLVSAYQEGPRWYRTTFDATDLPSGMYFYQVRVEGFAGEIFRDSRTLVHVK